VSQSFLPGGPGIQEIFHPQLNSLQTDRRATKPVHHTHNQHAPSTRTRDVTSYMEEPVQDHGSCTPHRDCNVACTTHQSQASRTSKFSVRSGLTSLTTFAKSLPYHGVTPIYQKTTRLPLLFSHPPSLEQRSSAIFMAFWGWYKLTLYL